MRLDHSGLAASLLSTCLVSAAEDNYLSWLSLHLAWSLSLPGLGWAPLGFNEINKLLKGKIKLSSTKLRHPGGACGYRFEKNGTSIVTLFDNEYHDNQKQDLIEFCEGADLVVWDGMFTEEDGTKIII